MLREHDYQLIKVFLRLLCVCVIKPLVKSLIYFVLLSVAYISATSRTPYNLFVVGRAQLYLHHGDWQSFGAIHSFWCIKDQRLLYFDGDHGSWLSYYHLKLKENI